jgi:hypothetical protein
MSRPKVTQPVTDNKERALEQSRREVAEPDEGHGSPSRAHSTGGGRHSKKPGGTAPKSGGSPTS